MNINCGERCPVRRYLEAVHAAEAVPVVTGAYLIHRQHTVGYKEGEYSDQYDWHGVEVQPVQRLKGNKNCSGIK